MKHFKCELRYRYAAEPVLTVYEQKNGEMKQLFGRAISEIRVLQKENPRHVIANVDVERYLYAAKKDIHVFEIDAKSLRIVHNMEKAVNEDIFLYNDILYVTDCGLKYGAIAKDASVVTREEELQTLGIVQKRCLVFRSACMSKFKRAIAEVLTLENESQAPSTVEELDILTEKVRTIILAMNAFSDFWENAKPEEILSLKEAVGDDIVGNVVKALGNEGDYRTLYPPCH